MNIGYSFAAKVTGIWEHIGELNVYAVVLTLMTFLVTKYLLKLSIFIPAPLIALGIGFVAVALSALNRQAQNAFADGVHPIEHRLHADLFRINSPFFVYHGVS